jgi:hypothetical protein
MDYHGPFIPTLGERNARREMVEQVMLSKGGGLVVPDFEAFRHSIQVSLGPYSTLSAVETEQILT